MLPWKPRSTQHNSGHRQLVQQDPCSSFFFFFFLCDSLFHSPPCPGSLGCRAGVCSNTRLLLRHQASSQRLLGWDAPRLSTWPSSFFPRTESPRSTSASIFSVSPLLRLAKETERSADLLLRFVPDSLELPSPAVPAPFQSLLTNPAVTSSDAKIKLCRFLLSNMSKTKPCNFQPGALLLTGINTGTSAMTAGSHLYKHLDIYNITILQHGWN